MKQLLRDHSSPSTRREGLTSEGHSFARHQRLIQIVKNNYSKLGRQAKRFLHALSVSYSTLEEGLANDGVCAKWPNVLLGKKGFAGTSPHPFIYTLSVAAFGLQQQSREAVTETRWPPEPKICTICPSVILWTLA